MQLIASIPFSDSKKLLQGILELSRDFPHSCLLNSNNYSDKYGKYEILCGLGAERILAEDEIYRESLKNSKKEWIFLALSYDLKNDFEDLGSSKAENISFPKIFAFVPEFVFKVNSQENELCIFSKNQDKAILTKFTNLLSQETASKAISFPKVKGRISKIEYLKKFQKLKAHIQKGNIYEANFCMEFFAEDIELVPHAAYLTLNKKSPSPFSAFFKINHLYLLSASPERFLTKRENTLITQPIKGTAKRGMDPNEDNKIRENLRNDLKEQTENVMIVDVARNDLSRIAEKNSVKVEELFGIYSFPQVHQMISTISCQIKDGKNLEDLLKATFPMASMTGAPKISAMKILDDLEESSRNIYSGSVGYISPEGNMDLSVVIRSLIYDSKRKYLSYSVGGAITYLSEPEMEYQECLLKAKAIFET